MLLKKKHTLTLHECTHYLKRIQRDYSSTKLSQITFTHYSTNDQKIAENLFAYQALLVDQAKPDIVINCR